MTNVASKNPYDLLGNDPELDPEREPPAPTKIIDKPVQRTGKRNAAAEGPAGGAARGGRGGRGDGMNRGDQGGFNNRERRADDGLRQDRHSNRTRESGEGGRGRGRGRGDRGERGERGGRGYSGRYTRTNRDDRQDHSGIGPHEKQAAQGWGDEKSGTAEWNDEVAGEEIARAESKDEPGFTPDTGAGDPAFSNGPGAPGEAVGEESAPVEEDKTKSYDQYLAEQAEKRLALGGESLQVRKANEGSKQKFPTGTAHARNPEEENFMIGSGGKARREKTQQAKNTLQLDGQYYAAADSGDRGGRGRGRGGRGGGRGDRGGRGEFRGRGGRGEFRGSRGDRGGAGQRGGLDTSDSSAFPALGGS